MKRLPFFVKGVIIAFFLLCSNSGTTDFVDSRCSTSYINVTAPRLYLYQVIDVADVTVKHCLYHEESVCNNGTCFNCTVGQPNYTVREKLVNQYSDITDNCLKAFNSTTFKDKYGHIGPSRNQYYCSHNTKSIIRSINITIKDYKAELDAYRDRITLKSGAVCKYSSGFCHDEKEGIDFVWEVKESHFSCDNLRKIDVSDIYNFTLDKNKYSLIQSQDKYFALELKSRFVDRCNVMMWRTDKKWLLVSEGLVNEANNSENEGLTPDDYKDLRIYFRHKQGLYDHLIDRCNLQYNSDIRVTTALESQVKITYHKKFLALLANEVEYLRYRLEIFLYIITIFTVLSLAAVLIAIFVYCKWYKNQEVIKPNTNECAGPKPNANVYDYISSEYDINSLYNGK